ncbi:MAG: flavodoxin family protein [Promethearchaeota archaeon]
MELNVIGISGSPVKDGNTETFLQNILDITSKEGLKSETINLSRLDIKDCIHCNFCLRKQQPGKYCSIEDDAQEIFEKVEHADILVLVSPVYFMRTSARMAAFIDRLRVFMYGNLVGGKLKNKIGVSAAVSWLRNGGLETTHLTHIYAFMTLEMIPVSVHNSVSPLGASAVASLHGSGQFDKSTRLGINHDKSGLYSASAIMKRAIDLANIINRRP